MTATHRPLGPAPTARRGEPHEAGTPGTGLVMRSRIARRLLVNYRADPAVVAPLLPPGFRPHTHDGWAIAGICLIRLERLRPAGLPAALGHHSENIAHRVAVEWDGPAGPSTGVFVFRRDTSSRVVAALGGRAFPGVHGLGQIHAYDARCELRISLVGPDVEVIVDAKPAAALPPSSIFRTRHDASAFFEHGSVGWSPGRRPGSVEGVELSCPDWQVEPLAVRHAASSFLDDRARFPAGSIELDHALLLRDLDAGWRRLPHRAAPRTGAHHRTRA